MSKPDFKGKEESKPNNRSTQRKGGRRNGSSSKKGTKENKLPILKDDINDSSYYYDDPLLREQLTNYSFSQFAGIPFALSDPTGSGIRHNGVVPTMMRIKLAPAAGSTGMTMYNNFACDGVQRAGLKNFTRLSASNAKTTNYQPQDITKLILALGSVMEMLSFAQRVLGSVYIFNQRNRDLPEQLVSAQGVFYPDLMSNYSDYLLRFNLLVTQFNKIPVPASVKAFAKSSTLYNNFYVDDTSPMAQMYLLVPDGYWYYDEVNDKLAYNNIQYSNPPLVFSAILNHIELQINRLLESATFNFIYSDILRLADKEGMKLMLWTTVPFGYVSPILYSEEFNLWVDNLTITGTPKATANTYTTAGNDVTFDPVAMKVCYKPAVTFTTQRTLNQFILNFTVNNPDVEAKVAATRLVSSLVNYYSSDPDDKLISCSDHYVVSVDIEVRSRSNLATRVWMSFDETFRMRDISSDTTLSLALWMNFMTKFKHAPRIYMFDSTDATSMMDFFLGDVDYYTTVDNHYLDKMFDAEWMSYLTIN